MNKFYFLDFVFFNKEKLQSKYPFYQRWNLL